jgi:hypothetical protein
MKYAVIVIEPVAKEGSGEFADITRTEFVNVPPGCNDRDARARAETLLRANPKRVIYIAPVTTIVEAKVTVNYRTEESK